MNIKQYFNHNNQCFSFTREQASAFAKGVAGDFNPIHDVDNRRFCVPGDLLFSVFLFQYGVRQEMKFEFSGMVVDSTELIFPDTIPDSYRVKDAEDKTYLDIVSAGEASQDAEFIAALTEKYVQFSGRTFPHILVPLMEQEGVMINPSRPLVIYKNMEIYLDKLSGHDIELALSHSVLSKNGKKAEVRLEFTILAAGEEIGHGAKNLILSGLRDYDSSELDAVIQAYDQSKTTYLRQ
jgi:hypothetical protein